MVDKNELIGVEGMQAALNELSFLESLGINNDYLVPAMRGLGAEIKPIERQNIPIFSGATGKSLTSKITQNGVGSVTLKVGPNANHRIQFRVIAGGAKWHDRDARTVKNRAETRRNARVKNGSNTTYMPVSSNFVAWVQSKLGAADNALQVAYAVAKSIGRNGIKARPIVQPTVPEISNLVASTMSAAINRMIEEIHKHDNG